MIRKYIGLSITVIIIIVVIIVALMMNDSEVKDEVIQRSDKTIIGFCADNLVIERWQRDQEIFVAKAMEKNLEVIVYNANENNDTQNKQIRALIDKKVDVIVVIPYDKNGLSDSINEAHKAGIKVISYDRLVMNANIDAYISFDNVKVGFSQAEALLELVPTGNYVIINGSPEDNNSYMFNSGYKLGLVEALKSEQVNIVKEFWADNWREEPAYEGIAELLTEGIQIDAIIGANDRLAEAAIRALAEEGLAGKVMVAGHDAEISACQRIVEGTQAITIYKPIRELAETAVKISLQLVENQEIQYSETINNGFKEVPYIKLDVMTVTKDTMLDTVIADGFHRVEDVYRDSEE